VGGRREKINAEREDAHGQLSSKVKAREAESWKSKIRRFSGGLKAIRADSSGMG
jgi:hypothetical protein